MKTISNALEAGLVYKSLKRLDHGAGIPLKRNEISLFGLISSIRFYSKFVLFPNSGILKQGSCFFQKSYMKYEDEASLISTTEAELKMPDDLTT